MPYVTALNYTIMFCMEILYMGKNCRWMQFGCGLQKSPGYRILVSLSVEVGNAQPMGQGIGVGKNKVKQHDNKLQAHVCVVGKPRITCFSSFSCPRWDMICRCFKSVYISTKTNRILLYSCYVLYAVLKIGFLHTEWGSK